MLFNSFPFLIFAPIFFSVFFALKGQPRKYWILFASYVFYGWWDWRFTGLLFGMTCFGYFCGWMIERSPTPVGKKTWVTFTIVVHILALAYFKYTNFLADSIFSVLKWFGAGDLPHHWNIVLPVGISFYTFTTLSYTIDIFKGKIPPAQRSFLDFATYTSLFPHLVAGPVLRARWFLPQLQTDKAIDWNRIGLGLQWIVWGFFLKLCVADNAAIFVNPRFDQPGIYNSAALGLAVLFFAFQIYADFCGYSLIAIGLAAIMGYDFGINFKRPYFATSFSDFWQRWHISLSTWIREYIYIPLGGNQYGARRTFINLFLTMFIAGLWHGAAWTFVVWGCLHGLYLVGQRLLAPGFEKFAESLRLGPLVQGLLCVAVVFLLTCVGWVFFRAQSVSQAFEILGALVSPGARSHLTFGGAKFQIARVLIAMALLLAVDMLAEWSRVKEWYYQRPWYQVSLTAFLVVTILFLGSFSSNSFIYFQF
jgi:alginate O-acetyltransferase complex protein AlgI